jgi:hypothetical protein
MVLSMNQQYHLTLFPSSAVLTTDVVFTANDGFKDHIRVKRRQNTNNQPKEKI